MLHEILSFFLSTDPSIIKVAMLSPLKLERSLEISTLCQKIISLHSQILCVSAVNKNGRIIDSKLRDDSSTTNLSGQELEMLYMQRTLQTSMNKEFDKR